MGRITTITPEQTSRIPEWVQKYIEIGLSTEPADFDAATEAALKAYALCNLQRPLVVLRMGSPYGATLGGILAYALLREQKASGVESQVESQVGSQVRSQVRSQVESQVGSQVWSQVRSQVRSQVESQVGSQVWSQVESQVGSQVRSQVESQVWSQVGSQVWSQVGSQVESQVGSQVESAALAGGAYNYRGGQLWAAGWAAYVSFFRDVMGWADPVLERFAIDETLVKSCGWVWWHENVLAISDRPSVLHRDDQGRLHCVDGPAIAYRDGWAIHCVHGVVVPADVIEQPDSITVARIEAEANAEVRRVMVERYGAARYLLDSGAHLTHRDEAGLLYRKDVPDDEPIVMVRVLNSTPEPDGVMSRDEAIATFGDAARYAVEAPEGSRFKAYMIRVPPDVRTAREAVAWTFGMEAEAYEPALET